jgi:hypothetical protein
VANIELYEALKPHVGDDGARLIAEVVPAAENLATKDDVQQTATALRNEMSQLRTEMGEFRNEMRVEFVDMKREFAEFKAETRDWMLQYFVPLWIGVYGTLAATVIAIVVKG